MPYSTNEGIRTHYEIEGEGLPILLVHGIGLDGETWRDWGYVDDLKDDYKLIFVDLRGHGLSDKLHESSAYNSRIMANDCISVLDAEGIGKVHFWGYSLGGGVGFRMAKYAPSRLNSLILGGFQPYESDTEESDPFDWILDTLEQGIDAWISTGEQLNIVSPSMKERASSYDVEALKACHLRESGESHVDTIPMIEVPCLFYAGEDDVAVYEGAKTCADKVINGQFVSFAGFDHGRLLAESELILPHVRKFLEGVVQ
jgi:pimeloyl-ACP methyl ester carboxylesterase